MNNWIMIDSGQMKFLLLFYSFNHPIYQEVQYRDLWPIELYTRGSIANILEQNILFSQFKHYLNQRFFRETTLGFALDAKPNENREKIAELLLVPIF